MDGASTLELLVRLAVSLAVVLVLMAGAGALLRRRGPVGGGRRHAGALDVLARRQLGKSAAVAVVRAGARGLVLGVTEQSVQVLAEADLDDFEVQTHGAPGTASPAGPAGPYTAWTGLLDRMRERTVRKR